MSYYKIVEGNQIIDVLNSVSWISVDKSGHIIIAGFNDACGILSSDSSTIYKIAGIEGLSPKEYKSVSIIDIDEDEYKTLYGLLDLDAKVKQNAAGISVDWDKPKEENPINDAGNQIDLDTLREKVLDRLSAECKKTINAGIDIVLPEFGNKHFSLELEDQVNLITLKSIIDSGAETVPYHADGELCQMYPAETMNLIIAKLMEFKTFQTTYYNSLKNYAMSLTDVSVLSNLKFGTKVPEEFSSAVLKGIS